MAGTGQAVENSGQEAVGGRPTPPALATPVVALPPTGPQTAEAPTAQTTEVHQAAARKPSRLVRILALLFVIATSLGIALYGDRFSRLGAYGYPGLFLLNVLASATLILPAPGLALAFGAGASLHPVLVGLAVGTGSAFGELTGYLAGFSGRGVIEDRALYTRVQGWMSRFGLWVIFILGLIPNPLFDIAGITAGVMRIPVWKFLAAAGAGKVIKAMLVAYAGAGTMSVLGPMILEWLGR